MALSDFNEMISFDNLWDKDDAIVMPRSDPVLEVMKDPFVTPQSQNLFYSGEVLSSTHMIQGSKTVDMNFGASPRDLNTDGFDLLKLDKSPWHESDSGVSVSTTMSEAGSPSGCNDFTASETASVQHVLDWSELGEGADDLAAYLLGTDLMLDDNDTGAVHEENQCLPPVEVSNQNVYNTRARNNCNLAASQQTFPLYTNDTELDVENSDTENSNSGSISPERHNSQISEPLNYFQNVCNEIKRKPAVKIVKVLKTSAGSDCCDEDIVKALDERSRKNAVQAKMNREKKKKYVNSLENDVEQLGKENKELREENIELKKDVGSLEEEVRYLKSVLVNASSLSSLLRNIDGVSDVKLSASIVCRKRSAGDCDDHSYTSAAKGRGDNGRAQRSAKRAKMISANLEKAGVCLHVNGGEASLEFCSKCSDLAQHSQSRSRKS